MQMARQCPQTRAYLIQMLGLDSESVPVNAAPAALGGMGPPSISVPLKQEMMPTPLPSAPAAVPVKQEVPAPLPTPAPSAAAGSTGLPPQGHPEATEPNDEHMAELLLTNENAAGDRGKGRRQVRELHGFSGPFRQRLGQGP